MNKAQGCLLGWQERFPLAASVPCPPCHPLGDINFPLLCVPELRVDKARLSAGKHLHAGTQTWGAHGLPPQLLPREEAAFVFQPYPGCDPEVPVPRKTTFQELQPVPTWSHGTPRLHPQGTPRLWVCRVPAHPGCAAAAAGSCSQYFQLLLNLAPSWGVGW